MHHFCFPGPAIQRRAALQSIFVGGVALTAGCASVPGHQASDAGRIKFTAFADIHHNPSQFMTDAPGRLAKIQARALREKVDCVVELGDFCHGPAHHPDFVKQFAAFGIPSYHVIGNHDCDQNSYAATLAAYHLACSHYTFDVKGFRFVVLDTNYLTEGDGHFENGNQYKQPDGERGYVSAEQIPWFRKTLMESPFPCIVLSHQSLERESVGVGNLPALRRIINEANRAAPHRVVLCINGHFHRNFLRLLDGVAYLDLNSASYDWISTGKRVTCYPPELCAKYKLIDHQVIWNDPIHAVITLGRDGGLKIDGMKSDFYHGLTPQQLTGSPLYDRCGRPCECEVLSASIRLW